ncbi:hypothetical protein M6D81_30630 [Paenibacillus sp. J5C_2022]|uniref:hypothetical protein n=1 Tax=Paenibacillus sp. J5C2022 TaxID=2977129 RepID=UPI0021D385F4|nr:hypothetical protein [Paenibacillus sp. J5C2022]MCU6713064.1 hypothetical protein [Paenibacillus sp. J5C2022]
MRRKMFSVALLAMAFGISSVSASASAPTAATEETASDNKESSAAMQVIHLEQHRANGDTFTIKTYKSNDGSIFYTIGDRVKDKKKVSELADSIIKKKLESREKLFNAGKLNYGTLSAVDSGCNSHDDEATDPNESSATNRTWGTSCWESDSTWPTHTNWSLEFSGTQKASWSAADPFYPEKIVLSQTTSYSGFNMSIGIPPSWEKSGKTISWKSAPIENEWFVVVTRPKNEVTWTSPFAIVTDADVTDSADIYVEDGPGVRIYRPTSEIDFQY